MKHNSAEQMNEQPLLSQIFYYSFPVMLSLLVRAIYSVSDSIFVAKLSETGLTALSISFPIQTLISAMASGAGMGANILIARSLGSSNLKQASSIASHSFFIGILNWAIFATIGVPLLRVYFPLFTSNLDVSALGIAYTSITLLFSLGFFIETVAARILQAIGCTVFPMIFQIAGACVNIILDPILIFGLYGCPALGISGAAIASIIGQFISAILSLITLCRQQHILKVTFRDFRFEKEICKEIYSTGMPSVLGSALVSAYVTGLNAVLGSFTELAVTALGIYYKLQTFLLMPTYGLSQGIVPIMSYNYGARNYKRMWGTLWLSLAISTATLTLGTFAFWMFTPQIFRAFWASGELIKVGTPALKIISMSFPFFGITILLPALFQATGHLRENIMITLLRQVILLVPLAWVFSNFGLFWVWFTFPVSEVIAAALCFYYSAILQRGHLCTEKSNVAGFSLKCCN